MKFKNITSTSQDVVNTLKTNLKDCVIEVFSYKDTTIIFSKNETVKHASLSNVNQEVTMREINYTVQKIMNTTMDKVNIGLSKNGVVHLYHEYQMAKIYPFKQRVDHND